MKPKYKIGMLVKYESDTTPIFEEIEAVVFYANAVCYRTPRNQCLHETDVLCAFRPINSKRFQKTAGKAAKRLKQSRVGAEIKNAVREAEATDDFPI